MDLKSKTLAVYINTAQHAVLELNLRRASLVQDTFEQLAATHHSAFKWRLRVYLDGDPKVTDVYRRDFFHEVFHKIASREFGMFVFKESLAWFPSRATREERTKFFLFGVLCGLALYNQSIVYLPFPLALFKKLLGVQPTLEDMKDLSSVGKTLQGVLDREDDFKEGLSFSINWDGTDIELDLQNPEKPVTGQNKKEFVDAYVNHVFNTSVEGVFQEFERGFFQVCDRDLVTHLFQPEELRVALVGKDVYNWAKLKQNTHYGGIYHAGHPNIQMFWEVFDELTEDQRKDFLWFLTGYRRVPILGMGQIKMEVLDKQVLSGSDDQHFPESLTCHSILTLPVYSTKEIMRDRLTEALKPKNGFLM
uniref:HECT-type E3 ubiquitin transferase n=2 Tax=Sparus aurata TaxID=8175 RepID=A0A671UQS6_SPAAU